MGKLLHNIIAYSCLNENSELGKQPLLRDLQRDSVSIQISSRVQPMHISILIDMYRLKSFEELIEKGILNQISEFETIVIEWPKRIDQLDLDTYLHIKIHKLSAELREIELLN